MQAGTSLELAAVGDRVEDLVLARLELRVPRELKRNEAGVRYRQLQFLGRNLPLALMSPQRNSVSKLGRQSRY